MGSSSGKKYWMTAWHERRNALPDWGQWSMSYCPDDKPQKGVIGPAKTASPWQVFESGKPGEMIDGFHKGLSDDGRSPSCYNKQLETCKCHEVIVKAKRGKHACKASKGSKASKAPARKLSIGQKARRSIGKMFSRKSKPKRRIANQDLIDRFSAGAAAPSHCGSSSILLFSGILLLFLVYWFFSRRFQTPAKRSRKQSTYRCHYPENAEDFSDVEPGIDMV